jgi:hypothetical protein
MVIARVAQHYYAITYKVKILRHSRLPRQDTHLDIYACQHLKPRLPHHSMLFLYRL